MVFSFSAKIRQSGKVIEQYSLLNIKKQAVVDYKKQKNAIECQKRECFSEKRHIFNVSSQAIRNIHN